MTPIGLRPSKTFLIGVSLTLPPIEFFKVGPHYIPKSYLICGANYEILCQKVTKKTKSQLGIFAKKNILQGQFLGNYVGEFIKKKNMKEWNPYCFRTIIDNETYIINSESLEKSNWTRFINCSDSKHEPNIIQIRCKNTEIYSTSSNRHLCLNGYIMFYALTDISEGSELFYAFQHSQMS